MKKERISIPIDISSKVLYYSDRTCCKCNIPGRPVQIHHIDENPANNTIQNLSVLCLICHDETMIKGGFGRKLDAAQVTIYRDKWIDRVRERRKHADEIASINVATGKAYYPSGDFDDKITYKEEYDNATLQRYLDKITLIHRAQLAIAQAEFDEGIHSNTLSAIYKMVDFYQEVLIEIATFYPKGHFNNLHPKVYFNNLIAERFLWHRLILEPFGVGTGGSMVSEVAGGNVMDDLMKLIVEIIQSLTFPSNIIGIDFDEWKKSWLG